MSQYLDRTLFDKAAKKLNEGAKAIAPDWLANFLAPEEASVELTDMLTPMGSVLSKGTGLISKMTPTWEGLIKGLKSNPPTSHGRYASDMTPGPHYTDWEPNQLMFDKNKSGGSDFIKDVNTLEHDGEHQLDTMTKRLAEQGGEAPFPSVESMILSRARQKNLPIDVPMISHHPDVAPRVAERAGNTLNNILRNKPGQQTDYVSQLHMTPKGSGGSSMSRGGGRMTVSDSDTLGDVINTVGHEAQHAIDFKNNPQMFKDYPSMQFSELAGPPKGYWNHPGEVIARAAGNLEEFKHNSRGIGQATLDDDFLKQLDAGKEKIFGDKVEEIMGMTRLGTPEKHRRLTRNSNIGPLQSKLPLGGEVIERILTGADINEIIRKGRK